MSDLSAFLFWNKGGKLPQRRVDKHGGGEAEGQSAGAALCGDGANHGQRRGDHDHRAQVPRCTQHADGRESLSQTN